MNDNILPRPDDWFTRENLIKWLKEQPSEKQFNYKDNFSCLLCSFADDITKEKYSFGSVTYNFFPSEDIIGNNPNKRIPSWAQKLCSGYDGGVRQDNGKIKVSDALNWLLTHPE
jgi:hypothetical protein